ncbi:hypothetical protein SARC_13822 [Sphaeroforma arctica JP610]|uniref:Peptidase S9 prolyl oligopeptidase catalytic domain-containing protein n=1 Tax=Sphaeroforma arctica JP610 TaxID=667725 RepID=A0A0L0FA67_9EUKA|nr:hypothetical protein SARC_13822 [Sphaeroforma arctica JP610]KNC73619.1 hypothetical protein SARC_13822 [Sphaeroforma arctica JP610]|eukprot:XP_014147521.1 hypothetical protein SARC_13822 [Sphaeroforma arctica JP610]
MTSTEAGDDIEKMSARPDLSILAYPVISGGEFTHQQSLHLQMGEPMTEDKRRQFSMELQIHKDTPKTFLWHTAEDQTVPVQNTYLYAMALQKYGIPHEVHVYPEGPHGLGLAMLGEKRLPHVATWAQACAAWLAKEGF